MGDENNGDADATVNISWVSGGENSGSVSSYRWWVDNVLQPGSGASRSR